MLQFREHKKGGPNFLQSSVTEEFLVLIRS